MFFSFVDHKPHNHFKAYQQRSSAFVSLQSNTSLFLTIRISNSNKKDIKTEYPIIHTHHTSHVGKYHENSSYNRFQILQRVIKVSWKKKLYYII